MNVSTFIYQESEIHFLVNPNDRNVMINATEMAQAFEKRVDVFLKSDHARAFIQALELPPYGGNSDPESDANRPPYGGRLDGLTSKEIISYRGRSGAYFCRPLALKLAAWLDPHFEVWVYTTIDEIVFGNYKKHWDAHAQQESAKFRMEQLKNEMLLQPTIENVTAYFEAERSYQEAKRKKTKAIRNQISLFNQNQEE